MKQKVLLIIPAYNEQENIQDVLSDIRRNAPEMDCVVINDCSTDGTREVLRALGANFLDLPINLGIGGGVQTGYRYALEHGYDIAIQFDGDGQHDARFLHDLTAPIEAGTADAVIGSRFLEGEGFQSSALRRFGIQFLSGWIRMLCGVRVLDVTSGMRAVNRELMELFAREYAQDYPEPEAIMTGGLYGARIVEVPVRMRERKNGTSSISPVRSVYYMVKVSLNLVLARMSGRGKRK